jgi:hypothetical protein
MPQGLLTVILSAYELYSERYKGVEREYVYFKQLSTILLLLVTTEASKIAENFKKTFSRNVRIHFVGVW